MTSILGAGIAAVYVYAQDSTTSPQIALGAIGGALVAFMIQSAVLSVLNSSVATLYICIALDPAMLRMKHPEEYARINSAWGERFGTDGQHTIFLENGNRVYNPPGYMPPYVTGAPPPMYQ